MVGVDNNSMSISAFTLGGFENTRQISFDPSLVTEEVSFGDLDFPVNGTFVYPESVESKFPCAVIIPDSGNEIERYGLIGPNAVYFDLAEMLAKRGIGVLIFDKRGYTYGAATSEELTIETEYLEDAVYAVAFLKAQAVCDTDKIFLIGHGMGGYVLPMIFLNAEESISGLVFMAANASNLEDMIYMQLYTSAMMDNEMTDQESTELNFAAEMVENVRLLSEENYDIYTSSQLLGLTARYWLSLQGYNSASAATEISKPMLFLYGERDYQVDPIEGEPYEEALKGREDVSIKVLADINHLFMKAEGDIGFEEYYKPNRVDEDVINEVESFIKK
jgi:pimeloyl-ACP methyl ester carboxylesterase